MIIYPQFQAIYLSAHWVSDGAATPANLLWWVEYGAGKDKE